MNKVFIARQPVYNDKLEVMGYELLFRDGSGKKTEIIDSNLATAQVILTIAMEVGLEQIVGKRTAFINVAREFLLSELVYFLDKNRITLELSEDIDPDREVIEAMQKLSRKGYKITLDNFVYHSSKDEMIALADYIKLDVSSLTPNELRSQVNTLRKSNARLIASKIETQRDFDLCKKLSVDYYQGFFLAQPNIIRGKRLSASRHSVLGINEKLQEPDVSLDDIVELISKDVYLTYRVFCFVNDQQSEGKEIDSLRTAVELVGLKAIRYWIELLVLSKLDDKPSEFHVSAVTRARMCELLANSSGMEDADSYFIVGLFSHIDTILEKNMPELLKYLPLTEEINDALLFRKGGMGDALNCVIAYEKGDWEAVKFADVEQSVILDIYLKSIEWASDMDAELVAW